VIYVNIGDTPGIRNWGRARVVSRTDERIDLYGIDTNQGDGCPSTVTPEQFERHFVEATPENLAAERARAEATPEGRHTRDHGDLWWRAA
jgi:hypothetical protein